MNASLKYWMVVPTGKKSGGYALRGEVEGHPFQPDGKRVTTSKLIRIEGDNERAVCESRTYTLGPPDNGWWTEFTRQGHTLAAFGAGPPVAPGLHSAMAARMKALVGMKVQVKKKGADGVEAGFYGPLLRVDADALVVQVGNEPMSFPFGDGWTIRRVA